MTRRRQYLALLGSTLPVSSAGCSRNGSEQPELLLPGEPAQTLGSIPLMQTESNAEVDVKGFNESDPLEKIARTVSVGEGNSQLRFNSSHSGTGQATGSATAAYQTAWEAPESGDYVLEAEFSTSTRTDLRVPADGDGAALSEYTVTIINKESQRSIGASPAEFEGTRVTTRNGSSELEEFAISTAVSMALGKALGLGFVARTVLGQIISQLLNLGSRPSTGEYLVDELRTLRQDPGWIEVGFSADEGDRLVIELATTVTWGYELEDSETTCYADCSSNFLDFRVREFD